MYMVVTVALYELKLLLRSRLFHLFTFFAIITQAAVTAFLYVIPRYSNWSMRAIPSSLPYTSVVIFNALLAIGGIFLFTEFLNRDLKLGTTDTVYYRSFPTPVYFLGKSVGMLIAIFSLEILILLIPFCTSLFFLSDTSVSIVGYLLYPLILTLPLILFITGLSWLLMNIIKSQPVTFIVGTILFVIVVWLNGITGLHNIFDYAGLRVPALYSSFLGFGNTGLLLMQRGIFASAGISLMALSSLLLPRLSESRKARGIAGVLTIAAAVAAITTATAYVSGFSAARALREDMRALNLEYNTKPRATMTGCDITVTHDKNIIRAEAAITVLNNTDLPLDSYIFSLNPGLAVESVTNAGCDLLFSRNHHLVLITPDSTLDPGATDSLIIAYAGTVDDDICYLDIPEADRTISYPLSVMTTSQMYGCITEDCVLLTHETLWYPQAGVPYGSTFPELGRKDFPQFTLTVETAPDLKPVSQGLPETLPDGRTRFCPATPLSQLSLSIAAYEMKSVVIDSISFALYSLPGHDNFTTNLMEYAEGFNEYVTDQLQSLENRYLRQYPFDYYTIVEVPIQFCPPKRLWTLVMDNIQPGITMVAEHGIFMQDIKQFMDMIGRELARMNMPQSNISRTIMSNMLYPLFSNSYTQSQSSSQQPLLSLNTLYQYLYVRNPLISNPFPNFYSFTNHLHSDRWPVMDTMMERYLATSSNSQQSIFISISSRLSAADNANMTLAGKSLADILAPGTPLDIQNSVMSAKVNQLLAAFSARIGSNEFTEELRQTLEETQFTSESFNTFLDSATRGESGDIDRFIDEWYRTSELPACVYHGHTYTKVPEGDRDYYQLQVTLSNPSSVEGLFVVASQSLVVDQERNASTLEQTERYVTIPGGEARCVSIVSESEFYYQFLVNTMVSQNLPASFAYRIGEPELNPAAILADTILTVNPTTLTGDPDIIIVDDLSPDCEVCNNEERSIIRDFLFGKNEDDQQYGSFQFFNAGDQWMRAIESSFYGNIVKSGYYKSAGDGNSPVIWHATISESGTYDVYAHGCALSGSRYSDGRGDEPKFIIGALIYTVNHDDGTTKIEIQQTSQSDEWVYLGSFYYSPGETSVELSDKSDGMIVYADAIKWVKQ